MGAEPANRSGMVTDTQYLRKRLREIPAWQVVFSAVLALFVSAALQLRISTAADIQSVDSILETMFDHAGGQRIATWCLVYLCVWALTLYCGRRALKATRRELILACLLSVVLSLTLLVPGIPGEHTTGLAAPWYKDAALPFLGSRRQIAIFVFQWLSVSCLLFVIFAAFLWSVSSQTRTEGVETICGEASVSWWRRQLRRISLHPRPVFTLTAVIAVCWIPIYILNGPTILPIDTMVQLIQFRGFPAWDPMLMKPLPGYWMTDHHPFFDSLIYGAFDQFGLLVGHEIVGLALFVICQGIIAAFALAVALSWVADRFHINDGLLLGMLLLVCFMPGFSSYETVVMKDSTWIPLYTLWLVFFAEYIYRILHGQKLSGGLLAGLILFGIFGGLTKKTSVYVTTLATLLLLPLRHKRWKTVVSAIIPPIIVLVLVPALVFPALHIARGGKQESLGLPMQQIGKAYIDDPQSFSQSDLETINRVMDVSKIRSKWSISTQDPIKQTIRAHVTRKDTVQFLLVWIKLFFQHPRSYIVALSLSRNAFVAGDTYYTVGTVKCGWGPSGGYAILPHYADCTPSAQQRIGTYAVKLMNAVPPFSFLGQECLYTAWIPLLCLVVMVDDRRYERLNYLIPAFLNILVQLVIPAPQERYSLGLLFGFWLCLAAAFGNGRKGISASKAVSADIRAAGNSAHHIKIDKSEVRGVAQKEA